MITNEKKWQEWVDSNVSSYGKACIDVARRVMELLDEDETPLHEGYHPDVHTPHGLICKADKDVVAGGISGFMAGAVASMVSECHSRGKEFRKIWNKENQIGNEGEEATENDEVLNPAIITMTKKNEIP